MINRKKRKNQISEALYMKRRENDLVLYLIIINFILNIGGFLGGYKIANDRRD